MIKVKKIKIYLLRYKLSNPVITSFGQMNSRPSLIIVLIDEKNNSGFGEIWCNFPQYGSEYRFKIFVNYFSKLILENDITDPEYFYEKIYINAIDHDYGNFDWTSMYKFIKENSNFD